MDLIYWRRTYFVLVLIRLYFALCPSYLHPDEHFQGPEVIAGHVFSYPVTETWEFTSKSPIRSAFPLWPTYGLPMLMLRWLWEGSGQDPVNPAVIFWTLRVMMFVLSFVLEDWAIHELVEGPRQRRMAIMLVASSYVTWTWQVHTFSNAIETLVVSWSLVLMKRVTKIKPQRSGSMASAVLAFLLVFGTFNRITFPAFIIVPALQVAFNVRHRPFVWVSMLVVGGLTTLLAIAVDTAFYASSEQTFKYLIRNPTVTPLNNVLYNTQSSNLALHGTHPFYQHSLINLPELLGPASLLLLGFASNSTPLVAAFSGVLVLSCFSHQEARFLLPAVPLILSSVRLPQRFIRLWFAVWIVFNVFMGFLMGRFHQAGIVNAQIYLGGAANVTQAYWWKTYSPPTWLLNGRSTAITTVDLMGLESTSLEQRLCADPGSYKGTVLVAPYSAVFLDRFRNSESPSSSTKLRLQEVWRTRNHLNLDDLNFGDDGVFATLDRVVGRRGLVIWRVECAEDPPPPVNSTIYRGW